MFDGYEPQRYYAVNCFTSCRTAGLSFNDERRNNVTLVPRPLRHVAAAAVAVAAVAVTAGCTSSASSDATTQLNLIAYAAGEDGVKYADVIEGFEADHPGVEVVIQAVAGDDNYDALVKTQIQSGTAPDLFEVLNGVPGLVPYADAGLVADLSDESWVQDQLPIVSQASEATGGMTMAMISQLNSSGVFYNKDLFAQQGIDIPQDWPAFLDTVAELRASGITPLSVGAKDGWPLLNQAVQEVSNFEAFSIPGNEASAALTGGEISYSDSPEWRETIQGVATLVEAGAYDANASGITWPSSASAFAAGETAMMIQGDFAINAIRESNPTFEMGYFPLPFVEPGETPAVSLSAGGMLAVPDNAPHAELAREFLTYLAQPEVLKPYLEALFSLSPFEGVDPTLDPAVQQIVPAIETRAVDSAFIGLAPPAAAALQSGLQTLIANSGSVDSVLAELDAAQTQ